MLIPLATTRRCLSLALAAAVCACATTAGASADIYELEGGGEVRGELVGRGDDEAYIVRTDDGAQVALPRDEIARIVAVDDTPMPAAWESCERGVTFEVGLAKMSTPTS